MDAFGGPTIHDNSDSYGTAAGNIISVASRRAGQGVAAVIDSFQEAGASVLQSAMSLLPGEAVTGGRRMLQRPGGGRMGPGGG